MLITNKLNLPQPVVDAVTNDPYTKGKSWRSVTQLIGPPRIAQLRELHDHELEEDASDRIFSLMGQLMHLLLERAGKGGLREERFYTEWHGKTISGGLDHYIYDETTGVLTDYKFTSVWASILGGKKEWENQTNLLALLLNRNGHRVTGLQVVAIFRDWNKKKARREDNYPRNQVQTFPLPLWTNETQEAYLDVRALLHQDAETKLPFCTDEDRWRKPGTWAVMRPGRKRASGVCKSREEAEKYLDETKDEYIVERKGEPTRCIDGYCNVREQCVRLNDGQWSAEELKLLKENTNG